MVASVNVLIARTIRRRPSLGAGGRRAGWHIAIAGLFCPGTGGEEDRLRGPRPFFPAPPPPSVTRPGRRRRRSSSMMSRFR